MKRLTQEQVERNEAWVRALQSGEYEQTDGRLSSYDGKYCCLGVACDLFSKATGQGNWERDPEATDCYDRTSFVLGTREHTGLPPDAVAEYYGWVRQDGFLTEDPILRPEATLDKGATATGMNDAFLPFSTIADSISDWLEKARPVEVEPTPCP